MFKIASCLQAQRVPCDTHVFALNNVHIHLVSPIGGRGHQIEVINQTCVGPKCWQRHPCKEGSVSGSKQRQQRQQQQQQQQQQSPWSLPQGHLQLQRH